MENGFDELKKLTEADNDVEANLIINLLKNNDINAIARADSGLSIAKAYTGHNMPGITIYVREEDYNDAYEIISVINKREKAPENKKFYSGMQKWYARAILAAALIILIVNLIIREL